jgi:glucosyl-3-phosphoglycerate synthase
MIPKRTGGRSYPSSVTETRRTLDVHHWFDRRTFTHFKPDAGLLAEMKRALDLRISVCLPALNEEGTVGIICEAIRSEMIDTHDLVDELVVMDSGSSDRTAELADAHGATVYRAADVLPHLGEIPGKGEALWKSLAVLTGDIVVWADSDTVNFRASSIANLVAPLLLDDKIVYTKGFYRRPAVHSAGTSSAGGRVTEIAIRPLLHLLYPCLTGLVQPLAGDYAGWRRELMQLPFFTGYAVEIGLLVELVEVHGLDAIAQVDLGDRVHRNRDTLALGRTAHEIMLALVSRLSDAGRIDLRESPSETLVQFDHGPLGPETRTSIQPIMRRPPMARVLRGGENG